MSEITEVVWVRLGDLYEWNYCREVISEIKEDVSYNEWLEKFYEWLGNIIKLYEWN